MVPRASAASRGALNFQMKYFVYILKCERNKLYTGISKDPNKRFSTHLKGQGAKFTKIYKPIAIVYKEEFNSYKTAAQRENQIKNWRREKKDFLIKANNK